MFTFSQKQVDVFARDFQLSNESDVCELTLGMNDYANTVP